MSKEASTMSCMDQSGGTPLPSRPRRSKLVSSAASCLRGFPSVGLFSLSSLYRKTNPIIIHTMARATTVTSMGRSSPEAILGSRRACTSVKAGWVTCSTNCALSSGSR